MTAPPPPDKPVKRVRVSDLRGLAQLATQATTGVARITEGVHQAVWSSLGVPGGAQPGQTRGLTGLIYRGIGELAQRLGKGVDGLLARLQPLLDAAEQAAPDSPQREALLAVLNGVMGDSLAASGNPLATPMHLRYQGKVIDGAEEGTCAFAPGTQVTGKLLLLVHGLCMNDLQWCPATDETAADKPEDDYASGLAATLGYSPIFLRYNSGQHISDNGRALSALLEQLLARWPVPVEELSVLAHSMGGLVIRSALEHARQHGLCWPERLKRIVFLGTPHHGAPLERAGNWVHAILGSTPYSAPFTRLAGLRSAGITDLRYGFMSDADWRGHDRFRRRPDSRQPPSLPEGVACFAVAATLAERRGLLAERLTGDGLVPLRSALGQHDDPRLALAFAKSSQYIAYRTGHMALLHSPAVARQITSWLAPAPV